LGTRRPARRQMQKYYPEAPEARTTPPAIGNAPALRK
jgi:hypothetical protein